MWRLTATFCAGNGGVGLGQVADDAGGGQTAADLLVGEALGDLSIFQNCRQNAAGAAGGCCDHGAVVCVLLGNGIGIGSNLLELIQCRDIFFGNLLVQELGLTTDVQTAGEDTFLGKTLVDGIFHGLPDLHQEVPDLGTFVQFHILGQGIDIAPLAEVQDFCKGMLNVNFFGICLGTVTGNADAKVASGIG